MFTKKAGWAAVAVLMVGTGAAYAGCTSVFDEAYRPLEGDGGGAGGTPCASECCAPDDCPAVGNPCIARTCSQGTCGTENVPESSEAIEQTPGDCKITLCDGNGGTKDTFEAVGTSCTEDGRTVCNATGQCVECNTKGDCMGTDVCIQSICVPNTCTDKLMNGTETDEDCGGDCLPCADGKTCMVGEDCQSQVCKDSTCQVPACDDDRKNGTEGDVDCGQDCPTKCGPEQTCDQDEDCAGGECTGMNGTCKPNCMDHVKNNQEVGVDCGGSQCFGCPIGGPCDGNDANCVKGAYCENNICAAQKVPGAECAATNECSDGVCEPTDKVCCEQVCSGTCKSCKLGETQGTCINVPAGTDPESDCSAAATCNGSGECKKPMGAGCGNNADCASGFCVDGVCCSGSCDGPCLACNLGAPGACVIIPKGMVDPRTCDGANQACGDFGAGCVNPGSDKKFGDPCTQNGECFGDVCRGAQCKLPIGAPCTEATKDNCVSYRCVNNVCAACASNADCPGTSCSGASYCSYPSGHPCNADVQCFSGTCMNGTCQ